MIEGLKVRVTGEELKALMLAVVSTSRKKRAAHAEEAERLKKAEEFLKESRDPETSYPITRAEKEWEVHERSANSYDEKARKYAYLAEHVEVDEVYRLEDHELREINAW
jgi:hypothetical protein